jgi:Transposase and inactivated derivatives
LQAHYDISERWGCKVIRFCRATQRYIAKKDGNIPLRMRILDIAQARVRYGYKRIHILLLREGWKVNHKAVYRIYCEEGLNLRCKSKRKRISQTRLPKVDVTGINQCWAMDFMSDALFNGKRFRTLTMMDVYSRECLNIYAGNSITGDTVVDILDSISYHRGRPERIRVDNGLEFVSKALDNYSYQNNIKLEFSRPGKPVDNAFIESFNGSLRDECLNINWFLSIEDAKQKLEMWRRDYNEFRPHSSLGNMTPRDFARSLSVVANKPDY